MIAVFNYLKSCHKEEEEQLIALTKRSEHKAMGSSCSKANLDLRKYFLNVKAVGQGVEQATKGSCGISFIRGFQKEVGWAICLGWLRNSKS